jgi:hypothetical protein
MALQGSGAISFLDLKNEFGGNATNIRLSEYYRNNNLRVKTNDNNENTSIPSSGQISLNNFYGRRNVQYYRIDTIEGVDDLVQIDIDLYDYVVSHRARTGKDIGDYTGIGDVVVTIPYSSQWVAGTSIANPAIVISGFPRSVRLINYGRIIGSGGNGGSNSTGSPGGIAIYTFNNVTIENYGVVAGGGGGGGGGRMQYTNGPGYDAYSGGGGGAGGGAGGAGGNLGGTPGGIPGSISSVSGGQTGGSNGSNFNPNGYSLFGRGGLAGGGGGAGSDFGRGVGPGSGSGGGGGYSTSNVTNAAGGAGQYSSFGGVGSGTAGSAGGNGGSGALTAGAGGGGGYGAAGGIGYARNEAGSVFSRAGGSGGQATVSSGATITWAVTGARYGALT